MSKIHTKNSALLPGGMPIHHWQKYPKKDRAPKEAKDMPKHWRGHNPPPQFCANLFDPSQHDLARKHKCKLYVLRSPSAYNEEQSTNVFNSVKLCNVNRVLSRANRWRQAAAFVVVKRANHDTKLIKIYP